MSENETDKSFSLSSRKKWFYLSLLVAFLNPSFSGLILGLGFLSEKDTRKEAKIILVFSIIWAALAYLIVNWFQKKGLIK